MAAKVLSAHLVLQYIVNNEYISAKVNCQGFFPLSKILSF